MRFCGVKFADNMPKRERKKQFLSSVLTIKIKMISLHRKTMVAFTLVIEYVESSYLASVVALA